MARLSSLLTVYIFSLLFLQAAARSPVFSWLNDILSGVGYFQPEEEYAPHPTGIPFPMKNNASAPWERPNNASTANHHHQEQSHKPADQVAAKCASTSSAAGYWYEAIEHNGQSSFLSAKYKSNYTVFRNVVTDYQADNTGKINAAGAIQKAIQDGPGGGPDRGSHFMGTTGQPAVVYLPGGTYLLKSPLQFYVGTVLIGDPTNPPILKAAPDFSGDHLVYAKDPSFGGTINFFIGIKNIVLDSTGNDPVNALTLLDWTVSQATQLTNVVFNMPAGDSNHTGLTTQYDYNSNIILNDLKFKGGNLGMKLAGQQWVFKNLSFQGTKTGVIAGGTDIVFLGCRFEQGTIGIDASDTTGSLTVIDSTGSGLSSLIISGDSGNAGNSIILENVQNSGNTVSLGGKAVLRGGVSNTWVHGNLYTAGNSKKARVAGETVKTPRSSALTSKGKYFTMAPPTYAEYGADQVLNVRTVVGKPVYGDGATDDTESINSILTENRNCKVIYFPAGTYIVSDTIHIPAGTRIVGDAFASIISGVGSRFQDPANVRTMVRLGYPGDMGVAQINDMLFTVADILPGCKMVEVNMAGHAPGDVGFWNTHFRIGGSVGSKVQTNCAASPADCRAAWGLLHLTSTSSAYIENMWGWTADHDLDGDHKQNIATGRGLLVEANSATWLVGTGFEHHTLYQYNFENARNVFAAMQQSETPYWQGPGNNLAPQPWAENRVRSDPDFSQCAPNDATCRMALFERIRDSSDLFLYGGCNWAFFNNNGGCSGKCQKNTIQVINSSRVYLYGTNTKSTENMILERNRAIATEDDNAGGWGGVIAAYLYHT